MVKRNRDYLGFEIENIPFPFAFFLQPNLNSLSANLIRSWNSNLLYPKSIISQFTSNNIFPCSAISVPARKYLLSIHLLCFVNLPHLSMPAHSTISIHSCLISRLSFKFNKLPRFQAKSFVSISPVSVWFTLNHPACVCVCVCQWGISKRDHLSKQAVRREWRCFRGFSQHRVGGR